MNLFDACPKIFFGEHAIDYLLQIPREKVLVVTDSYMVTSGTVNAVTDRLVKRGISYSVFSGIEPDPSIETVAAGLVQIFHEKPDMVIALGGGSAIDAAKAMLYFCVRIKGVMMEKQYIHHPAFVAIPTTSGTGSEVTSYAVISDLQRGIKIPISHRSMIPDIAILDPVFTKTLPAHLVAYTGMDVLTHAIEAFVAHKSNDFTNMFAREAASITLRSLPALYHDITNTRLREKMYNASTMAGLAFNNSGLGLCHGIAHTIGAQYHLPHGKANAVALPYVVLFNAGLGKYKKSGVMKQYVDLARSMGMGAGDDLQLCQKLVVTIAVLCEQFSIPDSLSACDIKKEDFFGNIQTCADKVLEDACTKANPVPVTKEDVVALLTDIYNGNLEVCS